MFGVGDKFFPDAAILIERLDVDAAQLRGVRRVGEAAQAGAADDAFVDFVDEIVFRVRFDQLAGTLDEALVFYGVLRDAVNELRVFFLRGTNAVVVVRVNHGAGADFVENFGEQPAVRASVENVRALRAVVERADGELRFPAQALLDFRRLFLQRFFQRGKAEVDLEFSVENQPRERRQVNEFRRAEFRGELRGDRIAVRAERVPVAVAQNRRDERYDALREERFQQRRVDFFDFARELLVDAADDADLRRAHGVGDRAFQVGVREPFDDGLGNDAGRLAGDFHRSRVRRAFAVDVGKFRALARRRVAELLADAVHDDDVDVQAAQHGDVRHEILEIFVLDDAPVDRNHENVLAEHRNVFENPAEIRGLQRSFGTACRSHFFRVFMFLFPRFRKRSREKKIRGALSRPRILSGCPERNGGDDETRTHYLDNANVALYQMSYAPKRKM